MAYQIQRKGRVRETLDLLDENGKVAHTLTVDVDVDQIAGRFNRARKALSELQNAYKQNPNSDEAYTAFGNAIVELFSAVFGEKQTETIVDFYDGKYTEMLVDVIPFVGEVIAPKIREESEARKNQMLKASKMKW